jgi:hypothetical protein
VLESVVAEKCIRSMPCDNSDDWMLRHTEQVDSGISTSATRVSDSNYYLTVDINLHGGTNYDNALIVTVSYFAWPGTRKL